MRITPMCTPMFTPTFTPRGRLGLGCLLALLVAGLPAPSARAAPQPFIPIDAGLVALNVSNLGHVGSLFASPAYPSCEYPAGSHVEHLYVGGLWIGARRPDGSLHVSVGAQDVTGPGELEEVREFAATEDAVRIWSNVQASPDYHPQALAPRHVECDFTDLAPLESGRHVPLGLAVRLRALAWAEPAADDFVILDYTVVNVSGESLRDVHAGFFCDATVGNTERTSPYDPGAPVRWNYYDDLNRGWRPGDVADDPGLWMMSEHDDDGEDGLATSWIGTRLLGVEPAPAPPQEAPPVSYNVWRFRSVPVEDDVYWDEGEQELRPGKYQAMGNGDFDDGVTPEGDFTIPSNWNALLSTGPIPLLADGDTLRFAVAVVCGADSASLLARARAARELYENDYTPVPAFLSDLRVVRESAGARLTWRVPDAPPQASFEVWRQDAGRERARISPAALRDRTAGEFLDADAPDAGADYWLRVTHLAAPETWLGPARLPALDAARCLELTGAAPNPFNPRTALRLHLPVAGPVRLTVHDLRGHRVATLLDGSREAGPLTVPWDGLADDGVPAPSGVYLARLETAQGVRTAKLMLAR